MEIRGVAFSPDGLTLAAASEDVDVWTWSLTSPSSLLRRLKGHLSSVYGVSFDPKRDVLISASDDNRLGIWNYREPTAPPVLVNGQCGQITSIAVSPSGDVVATPCFTQSRTLVWDIRRWGIRPQVLETKSEIASMSYDAAGNRIAIGNRESGVALVVRGGAGWRLEPALALGTTGLVEPDVVRVALSADGRALRATGP